MMTALSQSVGDDSIKFATLVKNLIYNQDKIRNSTPNLAINHVMVLTIIQFFSK